MGIRDRSTSESDAGSPVPGSPADTSEATGVEDRDIVSTVLDTIGALVVVLDREGRIVRFNRACERTTGYSAAEAVGRRVWDLFLPTEEVEPVKAVFAELRGGDYPMEHENTWVTREGDRRQIAWSNTALRGDGGELAFVIATGIDVTERRQAEQEIESLARFPNENPNPVLRVARDGSVLHANHASSPLLDIWGSRVGQPLPDEWRGFALDVLEARERGVAEVEVGERTLALSFAPVVEHGYVNVYGLDITARKRAQETLRRSEERYALAESAANIGSWDWDMESGDLYWSARIEPMFGFDSGGFNGTYEAFLERVHPEDRQDVVDAVNAAVRDDADYAIEHRVVWPDGTVRWVAERGDVIRDDSGRAVRMLGVVRDVTRQKEAGARIQEQNDFLASILESVTHPLYVVNADDYTVRMANSAAYAGDLPDGPTCYGLFHNRRAPCSEASTICPLEEIKRSKKSVTAEHVHRDAEGRTRTMEVRGYPLFDDEGEVDAVIEYCLDITQRKEMEQALRKAKETAEAARREERRRREEADRRRQIAESLTDVLAALNSNQPLDQVLDLIAGEARRLLDTQGVAICQRNDHPSGFSVRAARCLSARSANSAELPMGAEALERAIAKRQVVAVPDLTSGVQAGAAGQDDQAPLAPCTGERFGALLAAPIILQDEVYGGALLYYREPRTFSSEDSHLADIVSTQIARAVGNARLREQIEEAAATAERNRLARDLHDSVTQALFSATLVAETLPRVWERDPAEASEGLAELRDLTYGALAEMRTLLLELRPSALLETGLDDLLVQLSQAITSRAELPVRTDVAPAPPLPEDVQVAFYRVAQEALNNAIKHAEASELVVGLRVTPPSDEREHGWEGRLVLRVSDDGRGFDTNHPPASHLGMGIMRERAEAIGANLSIESQAGRGTDVVLAWEGSQR